MADSSFSCRGGGLSALAFSQLRELLALSERCDSERYQALFGGVVPQWSGGRILFLSQTYTRFVCKCGWYWYPEDGFRHRHRWPWQRCFERYGERRLSLPASHTVPWYLQEFCSCSENSPFFWVVVVTHGLGLNLTFPDRLSSNETPHFVWTDNFSVFSHFLYCVGEAVECCSDKPVF